MQQTEQSVHQDPQIGQNHRTSQTPYPVNASLTGGGLGLPVTKCPVFKSFNQSPHETETPEAMEAVALGREMDGMR
jgi:hypothetical protein